MYNLQNKDPSSTFMLAIQDDIWVKININFLVNFKSSILSGVVVYAENTLWVWNQPGLHRSQSLSTTLKADGVT